MDGKCKVNKEIDGPLGPPPRKNKYSSTRIKSEEKSKSGTQVAFGQGNSSYARYFPMPKKDSSAGGTSKLPKEYAEPWMIIPMIIMLLSHYSGNPEVLDEEEFGESSASRTEDDKLPYAVLRKSH
ncbi:hypothetical protein Zm00014a_004302 [Zea mays]|uniref:Uncharacterized protein n=1 Tax=Zea mays TaxID=4577 RepID=A0A3L6FZ56_MAIZE|nr:hypothetical protein Zm00014a_004302 [Zea mays]